jgi:hypothetical protein
VCLVLLAEPLENANLHGDSFDYSQEFLEVLVEKFNAKFESNYQITNGIGERAADLRTAVLNGTAPSQRAQAPDGGATALVSAAPKFPPGASLQPTGDCRRSPKWPDFVLEVCDAVPPRVPLMPPGTHSPPQCAIALAEQVSALRDPRAVPAGGTAPGPVALFPPRPLAAGPVPPGPTTSASATSLASGFPAAHAVANLLATAGGAAGGTDFTLGEALGACGAISAEDAGGAGFGAGGDSDAGAGARGANGKKQKATREERWPSSSSAKDLAVLLTQQGVTTLMLRNLPHNVTQRRLVEELASSGFAGLYDFCYMPSTFGTGVGKGYAFVNLTSAAALSAFVLTWHGSRRFGVGASEQALNVSAAALQGREQNARKWDAPRMRRVRNPALRPLVIGPWDGRPESDYDGGIIEGTGSKNTDGGGGGGGGGGGHSGGGHVKRSTPGHNGSSPPGPPPPPPVPSNVTPPPGLIPVGLVPSASLSTAPL